jgi:hypothetical protein
MRELTDARLFETLEASLVAESQPAGSSVAI